MKLFTLQTTSLKGDIGIMFVRIPDVESERHAELLTLNEAKELAEKLSTAIKELESTDGGEVGSE